MKYTLAFDVYGTLINTSGVFNTLKLMIGNEAGSFMDTWRNKQLEYSFRRGLMNNYVDFSVCTQNALDYSCLFHKINLTNTQKEALINEYTVLPIFPEVKLGLNKLKEDGHTLVAFSNGSYNAITKLITNANIKEYFDYIVSVENTQTFKPNPTVYSYLNKQTKSEKSNSWLISSNSFDVMGAISYGMQSAWLKRSENAIFDPWGIEPTITINKLTELSEFLKQ